MAYHKKKLSGGGFLKTFCIIGSGRMGSAISALLPSETKALQYSRLNADNINSFAQDLQICEGVIDISHAENIKWALDACIKASKPYMCGTTGLQESHSNMLKAAGITIPVLYAANTSLGIAVLKKAVALVAKAFGKNADITISETHHRLKKDAPSGTALELGNVIEQIGYPQSMLNFTSLRGGNVPGEHTVHFFQGDETIRLSHECLNRNVFADGAIKAAQWLFKQPPGLYNLDSMLSI